MIADIFELVPVGLALVAAVLCSMRAREAKTRQYRLSLMLGVVCAVLLIVAQTSWWGTYIVQGHLEGTWLANIIWTVFNSLVMVAFILLASHAET